MGKFSVHPHFDAKLLGDSKGLRDGCIEVREVWDRRAAVGVAIGPRRKGNIGRNRLENRGVEPA